MTERLPSLSIVLLAYHEADIIATTLAQARSCGERFAGRHEVIVVGFAGCKDATNRIVEESAILDDRIRLILQPIAEKGYGRALALGIAACRYEWILQSDADGQYVLDDLGKLLPYAQDPTIGLVHGYRKPRRDPFERICFATAYNIALRLLYPIPVRDADSAFKLLRAKAALTALPACKSGFAIAEMILRMQACGYKAAQLPITHLPRKSGEAMAEKNVKAPFGLQIPDLTLTLGTLKEMWDMRATLNKPATGAAFKT